MGEHIDKLKLQLDPDVVELGAIERVKSYYRTINGKKVKVSEHSRKGDGPNHRADMNASRRQSAFDSAGSDQRDTTTKLVDKYSTMHDAELAAQIEQLKTSSDRADKTALQLALEEQRSRRKAESHSRVFGLLEKKH